MHNSLLLLLYQEDRRNVACHLVGRGCGMTGPCVLGANSRFPTACVDTSVCLLPCLIKTCGCQAPLRLRRARAAVAQHRLQRTNIRTHTTYTHTHTSHTTSRTAHTTFVLINLHHLLCLSFLPRPASTFVSDYWKKLTCGVLRSFPFVNVNLHMNSLVLGFPIPRKTI